MKRTQREIVARLEAVKVSDSFGFEWQEYIAYLEYEHAKQYLKPEVTKKEWDKDVHDAPSPRERMIDYMEFAWEKANNKRGISACRSLAHYTAWLWLDGDDALWKTLDDYEYYGKPQLIEICKYLNLDYTKWDDGIRSNV